MIVGTIIIIAFVCLTRFILFSLGVDNYGYDYGFYNYAIQHTPLNSFNYFLGQAHDYGNHLFVIINWLRIPQLPFLHISFYVLQGLSALVIFCYLKKYSVITAVVGVCIFLLSVPQNLLHSMFLWKAAYGQLLFLLLLILLESKRWRLASLYGVLLLITHQTSFIITAVTASIYSVSAIIRNKKVGLVILLSTMLIVLTYLFLFHGFSHIQTLLSAHIRNGFFLTLPQYLLQVWYLLPITIIGGYHLWQKQYFTIWHAVILVSVLWFVFELPFYQRIILYFDLVITILSAIGFAQLIKIFKSKTEVTILMLGLVITSVLQLFWWLPTQAPQITNVEIAEIKNFSQNYQGAFVLVESAQDAPWLLANLYGNVRLAAPGLFEDTHSKDEWNQHFAEPTKIEFYQTYPEPLHIYSKAKPISECLKNISQNFYKFVCN